MKRSLHFHALRGHAGQPGPRAENRERGNRRRDGSLAIAFSSVPLTEKFPAGGAAAGATVNASLYAKSVLAFARLRISARALRIVVDSRRRERARARGFRRPVGAHHGPSWHGGIGPSFLPLSAHDPNRSLLAKTRT